MKKSIPILILCLAIFMCFMPSAAALEVSAPSALLMEQESGKVLFEKNSHEKMPPASVTKVMTLLLIMEAVDSGQLMLDEMITVSEHANSMGGSQIWLKVGEQMSVNDLLKSIVVVSANDSSVALAEKISGSEDSFVEKMNSRAKELGMNDTAFLNCTGLDRDGHVTSAHDIAIMSRELMKHERIKDYTRIWMDTLRGGQSELVNTNKLIRFYQGATGLKTGFTSIAKYCLSATAERDGMGLVAAVMGSPTSDERFAAARSMLDYGFSNYTLAKVYPDEVLLPVKVILGEVSEVQPVLDGGNNFLLEKSKASAIEKKIEIAADVEAPVEKGQKLGEMIVMTGGTEIGRVPIVAADAVPRLTLGKIFKKMLRTTFTGIQ